MFIMDNYITNMLTEIKNVYVKERFVSIDAKDMLRILESMGVRDDDFAALKNVGDHLAPDPTLPFRRTNGGRFCLDYSDERIYRLEFQPFVLSVEEDFVRHDSGMVRSFR